MTNSKIYDKNGIKIYNYADAGEIILHGDIIDDTEAEWLRLEDGDAIGYCYPDKVREALDALKGKPIDVHIASDGGNVGAGVAIYNALKAHDAPVNVYIDVWAASIASVVAMAGEKIYMPPNAFIMVHNPTGGAYGDSNYLLAVATWLDKLRTMIAETYANRSNGKTVEDFTALMDAETWLTAAEAQELWPDAVEILTDADYATFKAVAQFSNTPNAPLEISERVRKFKLKKAEDALRESITAVVKRSLQYEEKSGT